MMRFTSLLKNTIEENAIRHEHHQQRLFFSNTRKRILIIFLIVFIFLYGIMIIHKHIDLNKPTAQFDNISQNNLLDGCRYVYIDMGTNIGVQIRKLYEPHLYPNAPILPFFEKIFGNHSNEVCSVGFEANPLHDIYLKQFENYCLKRHWRVKIFTKTAVSITEKNLTFYIEPGNEINNQWGASLNAGDKNVSITVPSIDIVAWLKNTVLNRKTPSGFPLPKIMMKSDIEGHDSVVIANLILSGVYCSIDFIYGEHFDEQFENAISLLQKFSNSCNTKLIYMDDESYHDQRFPFIIQNSTN